MTTMTTQRTSTPTKSLKKRLAAAAATAALALGGVMLAGAPAQATPAPIYTNCTSSGCGSTIYVSRDGGNTWSVWTPRGPVANTQAQ